MKKIAVLLLMLLSIFAVFAGCGEGGELQEEWTDDMSKEYTIRYYMPNVGGTGTGLVPDMAKVAAEASKITKREINAKLQIITYGYNEYDTKMSGIIGAGVKFDVCYTSPTINKYFLNVQRQAFLPLDYLLPTYAPTAYSLFDKEIIEQARVNGKIYGVINRQIMPRLPGMQIHNRGLFEEFLAARYPTYNFDTIYTALTTTQSKLNFLTEYLQWLRDNNKGNKGLIYNSNSIYLFQTLYGFDDLSSNIMTPGVVRVTDTLEDGKLEVINQFDSPEMTEYLNWIISLKDNGHIVVKTTNPWEAYDMMPDSTYKPGQLVQYYLGQDIVTRETVRLGDPVYYTSFIISSMNAISSTSENPARAMKFIELLFTNKELHNLLQYGIKDMHYTIPDTVNEPERMQFVENTRYDNRKFGWGLGDEFMSYIQPGQPYDMWTRYLQINESGLKTDLLGFNFSPDNIIAQKIADCQALFQQYMDNIFLGKYANINAAMQEFRTNLKAAGADEIIAEKQRQLDAWIQSKQSN